MQIEGRIAVIGDTKQIKEDFHKREFILEYVGKRRQTSIQ